MVDTRQIKKMVPQRLVIGVAALTAGLIGLFFVTATVGLHRVRAIYDTHVPILERSSINLRLMNELNFQMKNMILERQAESVDIYMQSREVLLVNYAELTDLVKQTGGKIDSYSMQSLFSHDDRILRMVKEGKWDEAKVYFSSEPYTQALDKAREGLGLLAEDLAWRRSQFLASQESALAYSLIALILMSSMLAIIVAKLVKKYQANVSVLIKTQAALDVEREKSMVQAKLASLGQLAGGVAHEINNPLMIILGGIELVEMIVSDDKVKSARVQPHFQTIKTTVARIKKIIDVMLSLSGFDNQTSASQPAVLQDINVQDLVAEVQALAEPRLKKHNVKLSLIRSVEPLVVRAYTTEMSQVLVNLINNSIDAALESKDPWILIKWYKDGKDGLISVTDSGKGIPEKIRTKIFDPFYTTKPVGKGTGLGLSISRKLVEKNRGTLTLDTGSPNTCFVMRLPLANAAAKPLPTPAPKIGKTA